MSVSVSVSVSVPWNSSLKLAFHGADTYTDTDIIVYILSRIVARMSACRSACHRNNFNRV